MKAKYRQEYCKAINALLNDYNRAINVLDSAKWTDQYDAAIEYCNQVILKHGTLNEIHKLTSFWFRVKSYLNGKMKYYSAILEFLDTIKRDLECRIDCIGGELQNRTRLGFSTKSNKKIIEGIMNDIKEYQQKKEKKNKKTISW